MQDLKRREVLMQRMLDLAEREQALAKHLRGEDGRLDADFSDRVAFTEMDEVIEGLDDAAREELTQIRVAIERIDAGDGQECAECGEPIGDKRLTAVPTAIHCVKCAA